MYKVIEIVSKSDLKKFVKFPGKVVYKNNDVWVPPLVSEEVNRFDFRKNDYYSYGTSKLFAAVDDKGHWVGRIACFINSAHIEKTQKREGFFGFFETIDDIDVAKALFNAVAEEFSKNNITDVVGPINFSTNHETGLLIDSFEKSPVLRINYSLPYYQDLIKNLGFQKVTDLYSYEWYAEYVYPEKYERVIEALRTKSNVTIRSFNKNNFQQEVDALWPVYNESFEDVWGFTPLTKLEFQEFCNSFKLFADYEMIFIAELSGKVIGFYLGLPDLNVLIKKINGKLFPFGIFTLLSQRRKIKSMRLVVLCVLPKYQNLGVPALIIDRSTKVAIERGYYKSEMTFIFEANVKMITLLKNLGFKPIKTLRVYSNSIKNLKQK